MKIFLTGATGFLGYHIALQCLSEGHQLLCLHRPSSIHPFTPADDQAITWVTEDEAGRLLPDFKPDVLIHAAWGGVSAQGRNDAAIQQTNIAFTQRILESYAFPQIIMLGSQDEYGYIDQMVDESHPLRPLSEYAKAKIACCRLLEERARLTNACWQWVRIFSIYGEQQADNWLIPSVILKCLRGEAEMATTPGEQQYSYLYSHDFARAITSMVGRTGECGIFNLSSAHPITLIRLFRLIKELTQSSITFLPTLPYRENQSMVILGNSDKFVNTFGAFEKTSLTDGLKRVIHHLQAQTSPLTQK